MQNTLAKYRADYNENLADQSHNSLPAYKPFFFSVPNYRKTNEALESIITLPHSVFVEITPYNKNKKSFEYLWNNAPDFALCVSTISCYTSNLAHIFANEIDSRFLLNGKKIMDITTCMQEAIMNSMFHGNLKMQSDFRTVKGLYAYQEEVKKRLILDYYRFSNINICAFNNGDSIKISISDDGDGFSIPTYKEEDTLPNGRGLMIIKSLSNKVWISKDQKMLFMVFDI